MERILGPYSPYLYAVLRIVVGFLFACHGAQKLFGVLGGLGPSGESAPYIFADGIGRSHRVLRRAAYHGRLADRLCRLHCQWPDGSGLLYGALSRGFWPILNNGEPAVLFCFIFLYMASQGAGVWSLDRIRRKS